MKTGDRKVSTIRFPRYFVVQDYEISGYFFERKTAPDKSARMLETIYGCKWSLTVFHLLSKGINRPGEMVRSIDGLSTKVLNECLRKNVGFGILERVAYNEIPPRVEYMVTPFGEKFLRILEELEKLQKDIDENL